MSLSQLIEQIISERLPCLFVSPHLDDAVFSAGGLLAFLAPKTEVTVASIFTEPSPPPYSPAARGFMQTCGFTDAGELFRARRDEDEAVCSRLGARTVHLGHVDAAWRKRAVPWSKRSAGPAGIGHRYPLALTLVSGWIALGDRGLKRQVARQLGELLPESGVMFGPAGIGRHVDHLITRRACVAASASAVLWSDFPYSIHSRWLGSEWAQGSEVWQLAGVHKRELLGEYRSQREWLDSLVGELTQAPERFFLPIQEPARGGATA